MKKFELETDKMAPNQTRAMKSKAKELESVTTPLVKWLANIKKAKVLETSWARIWAEIKKWAYEKTKMIEEGVKVNAGSIMNHMNAPLMASFGGTKDTIVKFIIDRYLLHWNLVTIMLWDRYSLVFSNPSNFSLEKWRFKLSLYNFFLFWAGNSPAPLTRSITQEEKGW